ncbi:uncharacterized protein LOC109538286 isoform X2 [Dendroctonus ponderosae]|nr:uncharacterized protein LOC109538286 isoform X2 [Dendroctonus ponderosae]XP_048520023.1 uncharacterized protein LOC109538286 isoform X2 [Dendroctonus ponderosae]
MVSIAKDCHFTYKNCIDQVNNRTDVRNNCARFRLLIKFCIFKKCLHEPVEALIKHQYAHLFYLPSSILGDEILSEIFLSVLRQVSRIEFPLNLENASFLDLCWYLPEILNLELVPCKTLGLAVSFDENRAVIVNVEPNGVAAENGNIKIGDVLDQLNDVQINNTSKGRLNLIMKSNKPKPVKVRIVKGYCKDSGQIYGPIQILLKNLKIDLQSITTQYEENGNDIDTTKNKIFYGYQVKYMAKVDVGTLGNVKQVQKALRIIMDKNQEDMQLVKRTDKLALLEIGEIGLKIRGKDSADLILEHPYMKISSCGNIPILPKIFGYCAGEQTCDIAKQFFCYIFEAVSLEDADLILQSIGQGFHRTHYAV